MFYLGTHERAWLWKLTDIPLMVSRNRLAKPGRLRPATTPWIMDSGGFTEILDHGYWRINAHQYAAEIRRYSELVGPPVWAAPQDWMCEPEMVARTGLTIGEHQARSVGSYLELAAIGVPVIPVVQGYDIGDYERCADLYETAGVRLAELDVVGLGSVCRRQRTNMIGVVVLAMHERGIRVHGFGCKAGAIRRYGDILDSADSLAWSKGGKERGPCSHLKSRCANHLHYALDWRKRLLDAPAGGNVQRTLPF